MNYLVGATIFNIEGLAYGSKEVHIVTDKGTLRMYHAQDCCECVCVEDVSTNWKSFIGQTVLIAEERVNNKRDEEYQNSDTWTFYEIATKNDSMTIRWHGSSNGFYSESVDLKWMPLSNEQVQ